MAAFLNVSSAEGTYIGGCLPPSDTESRSLLWYGILLLLLVYYYYHWFTITITTNPWYGVTYIPITLLAVVHGIPRARPFHSLLPVEDSCYIALKILMYTMQEPYSRSVEKESAYPLTSLIRAWIMRSLYFWYNLFYGQM